MHICKATAISWHGPSAQAMHPSHRACMCPQQHRWLILNQKRTAQKLLCKKERPKMARHAREHSPNWLLCAHNKTSYLFYKYVQYPQLQPCLQNNICKPRLPNRLWIISCPHNLKQFGHSTQQPSKLVARGLRPSESTKCVCSTHPQRQKCPV